MAAKSDFAQKLLSDLRVRKEKMATTQNSSRQSTQTSRVAHGNTGHTSRGGRQINALESASSRAGNTSRRSNSSNRSININESSNQIVLYGNGQSSNSKQVRDLSMAIAFAFENSGNLSNIGASTTNPLVNFFNRFGRRSMDGQKIEITAFSNNRGQFPTVSNIHITEVSKGVQKLNQILRACSSGFSFDRNSIEVRKELLKGALDLEESLKMLVNFQEASQYAKGAHNKSRLKLLDEDEDDQDEDAKKLEQWKLDRPKFSFDKPSRNSRPVHNATRRQHLVLSYSDESSEQLISDTKVVTRKNSCGYVQDLSLSTQVKLNNDSSSLQSAHDKKRISNVVAKLMGLEELPKNENFVNNKSDSKAKQEKVSKQTKNQQQNHTISANQVNGHQFFEDNKRKQNPTSKMQVLNTELQQNAQNNRTHKSEDKTQNKIGYKSGANSIEMRKVDKDLPSNQQKQEKKRVQNGQQFQKQNLMAKNNEGQQESIFPSKPKKSTTANLPKKLPSDKPALGNKRSAKATEKAPSKDQPNKTHQDDAPNKENIKKEDQTHIPPTREPQFDMETESKKSVLTKEKRPTEVVAEHKIDIPRKVQRSEIPQKIDVLMSRRNATANHSTRSIKQPSNMLKDLKQRLHNKNRTSKRTEEQTSSEVTDEKGSISTYNASEMTTQPVKQQEKLQNEDDHVIVSNISVADESQIHNIRTLNDNRDDKALNVEKVFDELEDVVQPYALKDEQELKQCDQIIGDHEETTELHNLSQHESNQNLSSESRNQLTEPEKNLKEIVIKSHSFLSTAEALFKLNIPLSFLHAGDEFPEDKLILNCAHEAMKRKARRHENTYTPYMIKTTITRLKVKSLDDLIKQLCKDIDMLKSYGGNGIDERDVAASLYEMLDKDMFNKGPDVNCMWDVEWSCITSLMDGKEDVVRDVERHLLNGLLDEITDDMLVMSFAV